MLMKTRMEDILATSLLLLLSCLPLTMPLPLEGSRSTCTAQGIAVYRLSFETFWSSERFNKQYPTQRPHAQWSRLIGRTHSSDYFLWREGLVATSGVKQLAEEGVSRDLDQECQGQHGVYDIFNTPAQSGGVGHQSVQIYMDNRHPLVSLMSRLVPSPDWFVGADSLSLCSGDQWEPEISLRLKIWDAGTDRGLTFTAPNWPEDPAHPITEITSSYPNHVASSFYYDNLKELPEIARVVFRRESVNEILPLHDHSGPRGEHTQSRPRGEHASSVDDSRPTYQDTSVKHGGQNDVTPRDSATPRGEHIVTPKQSATTPNEPVGKKDSPGVSPSPDTKKKGKLTKQERMARKAERAAKERKKREKELQKQNRLKQSAQARKNADADCVVSEWQEWSVCSKTCGYGEKTRMRTIVTLAAGRGAPCPVLQETEMCGSMRSCGWSHFDSNNWGNLVN